jgi:ABC-type polysaccharide/polyol phosphate transport system ATPase subunit
MWRATTPRMRSRASSRSSAGSSNGSLSRRRSRASRRRSGARGGDRVIELRSVDFDPVLIDVSLTVMRGERIGIVGSNGAGKTVLAKLLTGDLGPTEGERRAGERARRMS